jgi:hypothetical protein
VHLAWGAVSYASDASGVWQIETVNADWVWDRVQLALGPDGTPHIAYFEFWSELVRVAARDDDGTWSVSHREAARIFTHRIDAAGRSHLTYPGDDVRDFPLVYEVQTEAGLLAGDVDTGIITQSMALGSDDRARTAWTAHFELRWAELSTPDGVDHDCDGLRW